MFEAIDYKKAIPDANSINEAVATCLKFYSATEEKEYGVLAIYFHIIPQNQK